MAILRTILIIFVFFLLSLEKVKADLIVTPAYSIANVQGNDDDLQTFSIGLGNIGLNYYYQFYVEFGETTLYYYDRLDQTYRMFFTGLELGRLNDNNFRWYIKLAGPPNKQTSKSYVVNVVKKAGEKPPGGGQEPDTYTTTIRDAKTSPLGTAELGLGYNFYGLSIYGFYRYNLVKSRFSVLEKINDSKQNVIEPWTEIYTYNKTRGYGYVGFRLSYDIDLNYRSKNPTP